MSLVTWLNWYVQVIPIHGDWIINFHIFTTIELIDLATAVHKSDHFNKLLQGMKSPGKMCSGAGQLSLPIPRHPSKKLYRTKFRPLEYMNGRILLGKPLRSIRTAHTPNTSTHIFPIYVMGPMVLHTIDLVIFCREIPWDPRSSRIFVMKSGGIMDQTLLLWDPARF